MKKRIQRLIDGLHILEAYSNDVYVDENYIIAGPTVKSRIPEEDQRLLEDLDWFFEDHMGWSFWLG